MKSNLNQWQDQQSKDLLVFILIVMGIMIASIIGIEISTGVISID
jgi:hypothetical protein